MTASIIAKSAANGTAINPAAVTPKGRCDEPACRLRFQPRREDNGLDDDHDQAALGEHRGDLNLRKPEFLLSAQCQPDLEDPHSRLKPQSSGFGCHRTKDCRQLRRRCVDCNGSRAVRHRRCQQSLPKIIFEGLGRVAVVLRGPWYSQDALFVGWNKCNSRPTFDRFPIFVLRCLRRETWLKRRSAR